METRQSLQETLVLIFESGQKELLLGRRIVRLVSSTLTIRPSRTGKYCQEVVIVTQRSATQMFVYGKKYFISWLIKVTEHNFEESWGSNGKNFQDSVVAKGFLCSTISNKGCYPGTVSCNVFFIKFAVI